MISIILLLNGFCRDETDRSGIVPPRNNRQLKIREKNSKPLLFPLHPSNMKDNSVYMRKRRKKYNPRPIIFMLLVLALLCAAVFFISGQRVLAVMVNGEVVGYIKDTSATETELNNMVLAKLKQEIGNNIEITDTLSLRSASGLFKKSENSEQVVAKVCSIVGYNREAVTILVEDKEFCVVSNIESARQALQTVLDNYKVPEGTAQPEFAIKINTGTIFVENTKVSSVEDAVKLLSATHSVERNYTVVSGDTFGLIASRAGMTEDELLKANPSVTEQTKTNLQPGQTLKLISEEPVLPIRTYSWETDTEEIPYKTITRNNNSQPESYSREIQEGVEGTKEIIKKIPYVNGIRKGEPQLTERVTKEAVNRIIEVGTYVPSSDNDDEDSEE